MSDGLRAIVSSATGGAVMGTGVLTVDGHNVAILHGVSYEGSLKTYDHVLGASGGRVAARYPTEVVAILKAEYADVLGHIELFSMNSSSVPSSGELPTHTAAYHGVNGVSISFGQCNIIPSGIKCTQGDWVSGSIEIRSVGSSLPSVSDSPGTWGGGAIVSGAGSGGSSWNPMTSLGDMLYGSTGGDMERLAGDTSEALMLLSAQAVDGSAQPPSWHHLTSTDIPTLSAAKISDFDTQVRTSRLDQMAAPSGSLGVNNHKITGVLTGTDGTDAANVGQLPTLAGLGGVPTSRTVAGQALTANVTLTTASIADSAGYRYCTDAEKTVIGNISGTNTGDETTTTTGAIVNGATAKTTPVDADMVGVMDSAASNVLKKISWANVKAALKIYFDAIYTLTLLGGVPTSRTVAGHAMSADVTISASDVSLGSVTNDAQVKRSEMGASSGVATLNSGGTLTTGQVPSDVTRQGSTFNGNSQLIQTTTEGKIPALDGSLITGITGSGGTASGTTVVATGFSGNLSTSDTDVQTALSTIDAMTVSGSGMANPMTAAGDLIKGGTSGAPAALAVGSTGDVLTVVGGAPAWAVPAGGGGSGALTRIGQVVADGTSATMTVGSIPGTYSALVIHFQGRGDSGNNNQSAYCRFNADAGANYSCEMAGGASNSASASQSTGVTSLIDMAVPAATSTALRTGTIQTTVIGYANAFAKVASSHIAAYNYETFQAWLAHSVWASAAAVTSVTFGVNSGNWVAGSTLTVYGME